VEFDLNAGIETTAAFFHHLLITFGIFFVDPVAEVAPQCLCNYRITILKWENNLRKASVVC